MLRPQACRWFELVTARDELTPMLDALACSGAVELQTHERRAAPLVIEGVERLLEHVHELARSYRAHWPAGRVAATARIGDPAATLAARVAQLDAWRVQADPLIAESERLAAQLRALADLGRLLACDPALLPEPGLLASAGAFLVEARVYAVGAQGAAAELPATVLQLTVAARDRGSDEDFVVLVGPAAALAPVDDLFAARKARRIVWPADLHGSVPQAAREVAARRAALERRRAELGAALQALARQHDLAGALADIDLVEWLIRHGAALSASDRLVWVSGWTTARDEAALCAPLDRAGLRCVVGFAAPPAGVEPPSLLVNPPWVRAFEAFARMLGQPGRDEADPSPVLAVVAPLLFGFMFGDVGQGAVLCAAGWLLRRRLPMLALLVPGGLMAMVFGLLFGSVFAREDLIPALWLHPLHDPVALLGAALGLGAAILLGGLALNALQAFWRRAGRHWWAHDAGLLLAYLGLLAAAVRPDALWLVAAGAAWMAAGSAWTTAGSRLAALATALAEFVEQALQLVVNTVSFARVGAFALAHAGLSVAVTGIAEASGTPGYWVVLALGNLLILVLEGLVVGIQTTRLLLFEFFLRFLQGTGRPFRPLPPPLLQATPTLGSPP
jgi:V/A-type H+-transporting ATPase subunit I